MLADISTNKVLIGNRKEFKSEGKRTDHKKMYCKWWFASMILLLFSCFYCASICLASSEEYYQVTKRDKAFGIHLIDEKRGWIVGAKGLALKTVDGGKNWQRVEIADETLNDIFFVGDKGWIVGGNGLILHTTDGGSIWKKQRGRAFQPPERTEEQIDGTCPAEEAPGKTLMKVFFIDKEHGSSIGIDGTILRTEDGGTTWEDVSLNCMEILPEELMMNGIFSINFYDVFFLNETSCWIVGDSGTILHSEDGGKEWRLENIGLLPPLFSIAFKNENEGWAVGQNGFSLKTDDGGKSWGKVVIEKESSFYSIRIHENYGVIVGDQATIIGTTDGGNTWARVKTGLKPPYPWLTDTWIFPSDSAKILSVGKGIILTTSLVSK